MTGTAISSPICSARMAIASARCSPLGDETRALRALVRGRDFLVAQRVALANQLRALLERFWPGAALIAADVDSPIALAFLARYPTPQSAERLGERRLAQFLRRHAYCGRRPAAELLGRLRGAPLGRAGEAECDASGDFVRSAGDVLGPLGAQIQRLAAASIDAELEAFAQVFHRPDRQQAHS